MKFSDGVNEESREKSGEQPSLQDGVSFILWNRCIIYENQNRISELGPLSLAHGVHAGGHIIVIVPNGFPNA